MSYIPAEPLTKETFWNKLYVEYPDGMKVFSNWIDEYKKAVDWKDIFSTYTKNNGKTWSRPKYHDLPFAMQIGIWIAFVYWLNDHEDYTIIPTSVVSLTFSRREWAREIESTIAELQCIKDRNKCHTK